MTRSISRAIASSGTSMKTFNSFVKINCKRRIETLALKIRSVRRARHVSEMDQQSVERRTQPIMRRRNSIAIEAVNGTIAVDPDFIALLQHLVVRNC